MNKKTPLISLVLTLALATSTVLAEEPKAPASPGTTALGGLYGFAKGNLVRAAEKMPEESYSFRPTPEVRTFGQIVGHVIDAQYMICGTALGETPAGVNAEKTKTSKADLVAALKASCEYCDKAFKQSDASAAAAVQLFGMDMNRFGALGLNVAHGFEHYGNMVTYMRIKGIVPPSSEQRPAPAEKKPAEKK